MPLAISVQLLLADLAPPPGLPRGQDREPDARLGQHLQRLDVDGGLGQPHSLGVAAEAVAEVGDPPAHLCFLVSCTSQRKNHVIVRLRQRIAVTAPPILAEPVGLDDSLEGLRRLVGHPLQERGAEVEADPRIVIQEVDDASLAIEQAGPRVRGVALVGDPLVPVVKRGRRVLNLDDAQPGILAGGLVKVAVDAEISGMAHRQARFAAGHRWGQGPHRPSLAVRSGLETIAVRS